MESGLIALICIVVWMVGVVLLVRCCCKREPHFTPPHLIATNNAQRQQQPSGGMEDSELQPLSPLPLHPDAQQLIDNRGGNLV